MAATSSSNLSFANQLRYLTEWFESFSPIQKSDFLPIMVSQFTRKNQVNGLPPMNDDDPDPSERRSRGPSIFECRMKFFIEWSMNWSSEEWGALVNSLGANDSEFVLKFQEECVHARDQGLPLSAAQASSPSTDE